MGLEQIQKRCFARTWEFARQLWGSLRGIHFGIFIDGQGLWPRCGNDSDELTAEASTESTSGHMKELLRKTMFVDDFAKLIEKHLRDKIHFHFD